MTQSPMLNALVLNCAQKLMMPNNSCSTLEIKMELRRTHPIYYWTQQIVSDIMNDLSKSGTFKYKDNGTFRTYFTENKNTSVGKSTKTVVKKSTVSTKAVTKSPTKSYDSTISKKKALELIRNNKGRFFTVVFTKKEDGSTRTMNCQYLTNQKISNEFIKVKEMSLVIKKDNNPIRQFATSTLKSLNIGKVNYKIK